MKTKTLKFISKLSPFSPTTLLVALSYIGESSVLTAENRNLPSLETDISVVANNIIDKGPLAYRIYTDESAQTFYGINSAVSETTLGLYIGFMAYCKNKKK